jgi:uncharacterized membrane protein
MMGGRLILALLVLGVVVWAIIKFVPDWQDRVDLNRHKDSAEETLRRRFARGEIDAKEYEERRLILLREETPVAHAGRYLEFNQAPV